MATRLRFSVGVPTEVSPALQSYTHDVSAGRALLKADTSALTTNSQAPDSADHLVVGDTLFEYFVSPQMAAGIAFTNGDAIDLAIQATESHTNNNLFVQVFVSIVSADGGTVRRTLRSKVLDNTECVTTATGLTNRNLTTTQDGATYTTVAGDRILVELSLGNAAGAPPVATGGVQGHNGTIRYGGNGTADLGANDTDTTTTLNPWIDFVPAIGFLNELVQSGSRVYDQLASSLAKKSIGVTALTIGLSLLQSTLAPTTAAAQSYTQSETVIPSVRQAPPWEPPNLLTSTLGVIGDPIKPIEWTNPPTIPVAVDLWTWVQPRPSYYTEPAPVTVDSTQSETLIWAPRQAPEWSAPNLLTTVLGTAAQDPVKPIEWALPTSARRVPMAALQFLGYYVFDTTPWPFFQTVQDLPETPRVSRDLRTWTQNLLEGTLAPPAHDPFTQMEWPNPVQPPILRDLRTWTQNSPQTQPIPFAQTDWPLPTGKVYPQGLRTWTQPRPFFYVEPPFIQTQWPNPLVKSSLATLRTWTQNRPTYYLEPTPFHQHEWPNPLQPKAAAELRRWLDRRARVLVDIPPFVQTEWPNPLQPRVLHDLRNWLDRRARVLVDHPETPRVIGLWASRATAISLLADQSTTVQSLNGRRSVAISLLASE